MKNTITPGSAFDTAYKPQIEWTSKPNSIDAEAKKLKAGLNDLPQWRGTIAGFGQCDPIKAAQIKKPSQM